MANHPDSDLVPYVRGELAPADRERVARHLEDCPECREDATAIRALLENLARSVPAPPPIHWGRWRAELRARLDGRRGRHAWWWRPVPLALSASLTGVLLVLAILGGPPRPTGSDPASVEEVLLGRRLELLRQLSLVERLDLLEDLDIIGQLDRLTATSEG
ncbi:MAG: hypothetical protein A3F92_14950 [Candidatus Rokubacteria bacterium RIFCSPLOWO2_12_FULL_71_22]|nr:MAG: hypothetical protein A3F92_14950 [Candidatus Rokubacteria bacterium RIFCSPLOWO2_12_FULL_71_22]